MTEEFQYINPDDIYGAELDSWRDYWDESLSFYQNVESILSQACLLPRHNQQMPLAATYLLIPTKWARVVGLLFSYGQAGSGKTTFAEFAVKLHPNSNLAQPATTWVALRNDLNKARWLDQEEQTMESEGAILAWDNLRSEILERNVDIYNLLLCGYSRSTETISRAGKDGDNLRFKTFCPKVFSSVDPIHLNPDFSELLRRLIIIEHKQFERFTPEDKEGLPEDFDLITDRLVIESVDWRGLDDIFLQFWMNLEHIKLYVFYRKLFTKKGKKPVEIPSSLSGARWTISIDIMCTGLVCGTWSDPQEAVTFMGNYWTWFDEWLKGGSSATRQLLSDYIKQETELEMSLMIQAQNAGIPNPPKPIIPASKIKYQLDEWQKQGKLDIAVQTKIVSKLMNELGWRLTSKGWELI